MGKRYIQTASDKNVEGVEFYVKNVADGYVYNNADYTERVNLEDLVHAFQMNQVVIVDNDVYCRAISLEVNEGIATLTYGVYSDDTLSVKQVKSFDIFIDVNIAADTDLLGKVVGDLQEDIVIGEDSISGDLKFVSDYTGFSGDVKEQSGNYLVLHFTNNGEDSITVEVINGFSGPVQLDEDGLIVLRIANNSQRVKVTSGDTSKEYSLEKLNLLKA